DLRSTSSATRILSPLTRSACQRMRPSCSSLSSPSTFARLPQYLDETFQPAERSTRPGARQGIQLESFKRRRPARVVTRLDVKPLQDSRGEQRQLIGFRIRKA